MGIDNVCFGYDFMDYFNPPKTMNIEEVQNASEINNLKLSKRFRFFQ